MKLKNIKKMDNVDIQNLTKNVELDKKIKKFSKNNKLKGRLYKDDGGNDFEGFLMENKGPYFGS